VNWTARFWVTFELVLDVTVVRRFVQPIDLFNHVTIHRGRSVDFDTLLYTQSKLGSVMIRPIDDEAMAHPSQLICHYIAHTGGRGSLPPQWNSLLLIPYYFHLGGNPALMRATTQHLLASADGSIPLFGKPFNVAALSAEHVRWISELTHRVETAIVGHIQPEVAEYLAAMATAHGAGHRARVEPTSMETVEQ
jgi:hypothetical protein